MFSRGIERDLWHKMGQWGKASSENLEVAAHNKFYRTVILKISQNCQESKVVSCRPAIFNKGTLSQLFCWKFLKFCRIEHLWATTFWNLKLGKLTTNE